LPGSLLYVSAKHTTIVPYLTLIGLAVLAAIPGQGKIFVAMSAYLDKAFRARHQELAMHQAKMDALFL
jgi:hypothetical protein